IQTYIFCVLLKLGKSMAIQSREENPKRLSTITPGNSNGAEIHLPEKMNRRRRGADRLMHAQCIRCRPVQTQTVEQIRIVRSMVKPWERSQMPYKVNFVRTAINNVRGYQEKFIVPLCLNGKSLTSLRDTGSS